MTDQPFRINARTSIRPADDQGYHWLMVDEQIVMTLRDAELALLNEYRLRLTATENPKRWTANHRCAGEGYIYDNGKLALHYRVATNETSRSLADAINAPTFTVAPQRPADLPEGIRVCDDGTLLAPGSVVRTLPDDEWTAHYASDAFGANGKMIERNQRSADWAWYEVRRIPKLATERVPWHEAKGRRTPDNREIRSVTDGIDGVVIRTTASTYTADADGTVEVLRDGAE